MGYIIIGFLLSVSAGLVAFIDKKKANAEGQKSNKYNILAFIVLLIGACLSLWSGYNSQISSNKAEHKADSISKAIIAKQTTIDSINRLLYIKQDDVIKLQKVQIDTASRILSTSLKTNLLQQQIGQLQNKLKNEITGGDSKPVLLLTISKLITDNASQKKYFIIFFDILNHGNYAIQNVKASVNDMYGMDMLKYGVKIKRDGLVYRELRPDVNDLNNYNPVNHIDEIGSISKGSKFLLYTTTYCPELSKAEPGFSVEINWFNGHFTYFINMKTVGETLNLSSVELVYNGTKIRYNDYFNFLKYK